MSRQGIYAAEYKRMYQSHGVSVRWFKAVPVPVGTTGPNGEARDRDGYCYIEQSIPDARVMIGRLDEAIQDADFGQIDAGSLMLSYFPDEIALARLDRFLLPESQLAPLRANEVIKRASSGNIDKLPLSPVNSLSSVFRGTTAYTIGTHCQSTETGIEWLGATRPDAGQEYSCEWLYTPYLVALGSSHSAARKDPDGQSLPCLTVLTLKHSVKATD